MNERIKELRKALGLTLEKFGNNLGVKKSAISDIESGKNNVSEQMINSICKTDWNGKWVSQDWLRTGEGNMFRELAENEILLALMNDIMKEKPESFRKAFVEQLAVINDEQWAWIENFCLDVVRRMSAGREGIAVQAGGDLPLDVADQQ